MKTIKIPDWCEIGKTIEFYAGNEDGEELWYRDVIIGYTDDGFIHQGHNCPMYEHKFTDYGKTVRERTEKSYN